ncbi:hypothetical protein [Pedobacter sp. GR22-6]|uniref:hypothetical protein n=1 Tax=Pedobacter sp. GR22-6 TaxID=3127957 RepID=UPI00307DF61B
MKVLLSLLICFINLYVYSDEAKVQDLRKLFYAAENSRTAYQKLAASVAGIDTKSAPILVCYKGVTEMMAAKYTLNPFSKMSSFRKGKSLLEKAVKQDPEHPEIRFLRFSVQTNLPGFLGYDEHIQEDKQALLKQLPNIEDKDLKNKVIQYLSSSKYCSEEEKKNIAK